MGAFKDKKSGSWYVQFRYTDWQGKRQQKLKRGFSTRHEKRLYLMFSLLSFYPQLCCLLQVLSKQSF